MVDELRAESAQNPSEEEQRLAHALVNRALVTHDEIKQSRPASGGAVGPQALLDRLVESHFLTPHQARRVHQELDLYVGQQIPGYQLLEKLGQGSMGIVFKARQVSMNRLVAVKVLHPRLASNPKDLELFLREAHVAAKLSHSNVVQAIDAGSAGKLHYFVMEYIEGTTIKEEIEKGQNYGEKAALEIILQIAYALDHAHRRGLVHRDIKPANIVLTTDGVAKLADLGLARPTGGVALVDDEKGLIRGTPFYISPEQIQGQEDIDARADIYALGGTLYHMVTSRPPFKGKTVRATFEAHLREELTPPDHINTELSSGLGEVVEFMMAKDRNKRYPTPRELIADLDDLLAGAPPKFARQRIQSSMLIELAHGEAAEDEDDGGAETPRGTYLVLIGVLAGLLALSFLINLLLFLRGH